MKRNNKYGEWFDYDVQPDNDDRDQDLYDQYIDDLIDRRRGN